VSWPDALVGFVVAHMVGDYLFQTDWQARHKRGGLTIGGATARRALFTHVSTYTLAFVPALVWIGDQVGVTVAVVSAVLIFIPHLVVDDGRIVPLYLRRVKGAAEFDPGLATSVDQSLHVLSLWAVAIVVGLT
jgi:hypothetical protein